MTLASFFSQIMAPCGASSNPPKSPGPDSSPNTPLQIESSSLSKQQEVSAGETSQEDKATTAVQTSASQTVIDCSALMDKSTLPGQTNEDVVVTCQRGHRDVVEVTPSEHADGDEIKVDRSKVDSPNKDSEALERVLGFETIAQLTSKAWDDRAKAVQTVRERVEADDFQGSSAAELFVVGMSAVQGLLSDRVMPVYLGALELTRLLIVEFAPRHKLTAEMLERAAETTIPSIVDKTSERNARSIEATHQALNSIAKSLGCRCIMVHVLAPVANAKATEMIRGRLELLEQMIDNFGLSKSCGVSLSAVMGWVRPHLEAADEKVRHAAVEVTVSCYSHKGDRTQQYVSNLKPALLKLLEQRFAEVDRSGNRKEKKSKSRGSRRTDRKLPALKGQQGQQVQRMTSRSSHRSNGSSGSRDGNRSGSSSSGRQSSSAGSTDSQGNTSKHLGPALRGTNSVNNSSPSFSSLRSPISNRLPSSMQLDALGISAGQPIMPTDKAESPDRFGTTNPPASSSMKDLLDREDEAFMKELEGLC